MSDRPDQPDKAPDTPAGDVSGGSDPNRPAPGHEGESAFEASGSTFGRAKHPVTTSGEPAEGSGPAAGEPPVPPGEDTGGEALARPPAQTDSRLPEPREGVQRGEAYVGPGRTAPVERAHRRREDIDRRAARRAERLIAFWFMLSALGTLTFVAVNFAGDKQSNYYTPVLGTSLGIGLVGIGFGAILWAKRLMPDEEAVQEREPHFSPERERLATDETLERGLDEAGVARRPLLRRTLLGSLSALGLFAIIPITNLYNRKPGRSLFETNWKKSARLVTEDGTPVRLGDLAIGGILTVFPSVPVQQPDGTTRYEPQTNLEAAGDSTTLLIRLRPGENRPRKGREGWEYDGHVAYSKICTHAGCPVGLYEQQTHHLLCPCHQSLFDVLDGCRAIFGPATRSLPQLAITVDEDGYFIARDGDYTEPIGPAFWERN